MSILGLDHVAIAVHDLEPAIDKYEKVLDVEAEIIVQENQGARLAVFSWGETRIELLEPLDADNALASFLDDEGEGLHHVAVKTDDVESDLDRMKDLEDVTCIDEQPREGAEDYRIAFLHPSDLHGTLLELAEPPV